MRVLNGREGTFQGVSRTSLNTPPSLASYGAALPIRRQFAGISRSSTSAGQSFELPLAALARAARQRLLTVMLQEIVDVLLEVLSG
jgi:hypothetical protein